ncbi:GTPase IMAP family member 7-like isoform X4 [Simochromis diagramma]|uniref:GTPase IMAP family member 7-like isoform X4 n=1 Tax=Simochromis diagramma TaxID=43689 RepID=UPI001A7E9081|nr:GTPase IMAP family member 7-like isoform X4 [Simochromis diagramma]
MDKINQCFSDEALRFATVLFTHGDQLPEGMKIEEFVKQNNDLRDLIKKCGGRCHVIDNKNWKNNQGDEYRTNKYQVAELLKKINTIIDANRGGSFTNEMLQEVKRDIQQEEACIKRSFPDITEEETATKAKNAVFDMLLKAAEVKTGALLGSFLGGETKLVKEEISVGSAAGAAEVKGILPDAATTWESARRIVLLGKTGAGKSSTAKTLCGEPVFEVNHTPKSGTSECQAKYMSVGGRMVVFIDTPGYIDTNRSEEEMKFEILRCITECAPGPHVFLIVLRVEKYTEHEKAVIDKINQYFSDEAFRFTIIIFTHGEQLPEGMKIEEFVKQNNDLSDLIKKCGGRCHVIDNKYWKNNQGDEYRTNKYQVAELLKTIDKIIEANKGGYFTNDMLQEVKRDIQQEEGRIKQSSPDLTEVRCLIL